MSSAALDTKIRRAVSRNNEAPGNALEREIERAGDLAFDKIVALLTRGELKKPGQRMRATYLLAILTRHQCVDRLDELARWAAAAADSEHREERSSGVISLVHLPRLMRSRGIAKERVKSVEQVAKDAVARARLHGLNETATRLLAASE